jgi:hypothetical protein
MSLDARNLVARVITLVFRWVRVLDALRVNDKKSRLGIPPKALSKPADHIFLMPLPRGFDRHRVSGSTSDNRRNRSAIPENPTAAFAIGSRFSKYTRRRRKPHKDPLLLASFFSSPSSKRVQLSFQMLLG